MGNLDHVARLSAADHGLAVFTVARPDGSVHASVVSAGVLDDPVDGSPGVAAVVGGGTRKLDLLRQVGRATLVFKDGFDWSAVAGPIRLIGPDAAPSSCGRTLSPPTPVAPDSRARRRP